MPDTFGKISERADGRAFFFIACLSFLRAWSVRVVELFKWQLSSHRVHIPREQGGSMSHSIVYAVPGLVHCG